MAGLDAGRSSDRSVGAQRARAGAIILSALVLCVHSPTQASPLEVYGRLPTLENLALSPDGSRIAFVSTRGDDRYVQVYSVADHAILGGVRAADQKLRYIQWAGNDYLLIVHSVTAVPIGFIGPPQEWYHMAVYDLKNNKLFQVPNGEPMRGFDVMNTISGRVAVRRLGDRMVLFVPGLAKTSSLVGALIQVDLESHGAHLVRSGVGMTSWVIDDAGEIAAERTYRDSDGKWSIAVRRDGRLREAVSGTDALDAPQLLGWGPTADTLLLERLEDGDPVWRLLSVKDGSIGPPLAERKVLSEPIQDPVTHRMIGGVHVGDTLEYVFFDPDLQRSWDAIVARFAGAHVHLESASADFHKVIVQVEGIRDGFVYALVDNDTHGATILGHVYAGLSGLLEVRCISYAAADGLVIPAYLTLPPDKPAKKLALIVLPHGGPAARDTADFDWWSQALADQGYAVLQPNYRGSDLSRAFLAKGFGELGRKMQTDLSDGVRYLVKEGIADPGRVCIVGASYGGYAALAGASLDPGVYRCAVSVAGVSDVRRVLEWVNDQHIGQSSSTQRYWDRFMGVSGPHDPKVVTMSPIDHVDAINVPVLLIHGRDDTVVRFEQSQVMYDALRSKGKDVQLVTLKDEDHWLSRGGTRLQMLEASVAFLRAHNPPE